MEALGPEVVCPWIPVAGGRVSNGTGGRYSWLPRSTWLGLCWIQDAGLDRPQTWSDPASLFWCSHLWGLVEPAEVVYIILPNARDIRCRRSFYAFVLCCVPSLEHLIDLYCWITWCGLLEYAPIPQGAEATTEDLSLQDRPCQKLQLLKQPKRNRRPRGWD